MSGTWSLVEGIRIGWSELLPQEVGDEGNRHMDLDFFLNTRRYRVFGDVKERKNKRVGFTWGERVSRMFVLSKMALNSKELGVGGCEL